ncbi:hypothetical protein [Sphingobium sp. MP9-4]|uniref:hypothetical protein n=1 Tax=Sphingobium sp. MP9-4 TaxID=1761936 RepID=UPI0010CA919F|nr:hypothetical protein [Sphingobium sp. MP9-4]
MKQFKTMESYLNALALNPSLAILTYQMVADGVGLTRAAIARQVKNGALEGVSIDGSNYVLAESVIRKNKEHANEVAIIKAALEDFARRGETTTYEPVMALTGRTHTNPNDRGMIGKILGAISRDTMDKHGFLLSALVFNKTQKAPTGSFFGLAEEIDEENYQEWDSAEEYLHDQLRKIFDHYRRP